MPSSRVRLLVLASSAFALMAAARPVAPSATVTLDLATIHAQTLTTARGAGDTTDAPFLLVSVVHDAARTASHHLPEAPHWTIAQDAIVPARGLTSVTLAPGDTVRLLLSLLENEGTSVEAAKRAVASATSQMAHLAHSATPHAAPTPAQVTSSLAPIINAGAHWIGSSTLLLTNEGGTLYWREVACVQTCSVLNPGAPTQPLAIGGKPVASVVELTGSGGTFHMQVTARRTA
jgi:hypothetical protein